MNTPVQPLINLHQSEETLAFIKPKDTPTGRGYQHGKFNFFKKTCRSLLGLFFFFYFWTVHGFGVSASAFLLRNVPWTSRIIGLHTFLELRLTTSAELKLH